MGLEWSGISTTLGNEEAKRTTTNPDFAALFVKKFKELKIGEGDIVVANMSSSFPALNIALISALDTLNIKGILVNSSGASNYGGNIEEFDYLDMENYLFSKGFIKNRSIAYSFGGVDDIGKEFEKNIRERIRDKNKKYGLELLYNPDIEKNIEERYQFYLTKGGDKIKAFINIGRNLLALGRGSDIVVNEGVVLDKSENLSIKNGLVGKFLKNDTPVFYLLNIKGIAINNGIPVDPVPLPEIGTSSLYYEKVDNLYYNLAIVVIFLGFILKNLYFRKTLKPLDKIIK